MKKTVIIIGGGAAGMIAAGRCAQLENKVILLEKNEKLGKKLYITGKGRCNITNNCEVEKLIENTISNPYFMYSSFYSFDNQAVIQFFNNNGVETKIERGNRVFPVSDKASDVVSALAAYCKKNNVDVRLNSRVSEIIVKDGKACGAKVNGREIFSDSVIIATGGLSYPATGSDGDGYKMAKTIGHSTTKLEPSLVPLKTKEQWPKDLQGLSLKNVEISLKTDKDSKKFIYKDFGEMLFTHYGISGPIILSASCYLKGKFDKNCKLFIDLKPALSEKELDLRLLRDFEKNLNKEFKNSLDELLPQRMIPVIIELSEIDFSKKVNSITKEERLKLVNILKNLEVTIIGQVGFGEAIITSGGINVDEIDPSTMESKLVKGLYFAGEVIDVDAYTGGFNLQIAFSTGYLAGTNGGN